MSNMYEITIVATGEVRDKDGNLLSSSPIEMTGQVTEEEAIEMGLIEKED
jgi:hypothetical protein